MAIQSSENRLTLTQGDTLVLPTATLKDSAGARYDLTGASVSFRMVNYYTGVVAVNNRAAVIRQTDSQPSTWGEVAYVWNTAETDTPGLYQCWFIVSNSGRTSHFPSDGDFYLLILEAP